MTWSTNWDTALFFSSVVAVVGTVLAVAFYAWLLRCIR